jgi:hypothetical protein
MKKALPLIILLCAVCAFSQVKPVEKEQSKLEQFSSKSGTLIQKQFVDLGTVKKVKVELMTLTDLGSGLKISGIRFSFEVTSSYTSDEKIAFLDFDEVDGLIKSISLLKSKVFTSTPTNYTEVMYSSRSGDQAGAFWSDNKWTAYMRLEKYDSKSFLSLEPADFDGLLTILTRAKEQATK